MLKVAIVSTLLILLPVPALAQLRDFPEYQYQKYENQLREFFDAPIISDHNGKYLRQSDQQRRWRGRYLCFALENENPAKYLTNTMKINGHLYKDTKQLNSENAYLLGTAVAAVDSLCTENREGLMDFMDTLNKK